MLYFSDTGFNPLWAEGSWITKYAGKTTVNISAIGEKTNVVRWPISNELTMSIFFFFYKAISSMILVPFTIKYGIYDSYFYQMQ